MKCFLIIFVAFLPASFCAISGAKIIGGQDARAGQFPYAAALYIQDSGRTTFCGGALITNLYVLTAGHCLYGAILVTIQLGSIQLSGSDPNRVTLATEEIFVHPDFNPESFANDIELVRFRSEVPLTDYIRPTSFLPSGNLPGSSFVTTFGWGQLNDATPGLVNGLQYVSLTTVSNTNCQLVYGDVILDSMVCVTGSYNQGICLGDSGSPLVQYMGGGNTIVSIVGIGSFTSTNGCESTDPSGFTRVFPYKNWIQNVTTLLT